jgi:hypothetical protein
MKAGKLLGAAIILLGGCAGFQEIDAASSTAIDPLGAALNTSAASQTARAEEVRQDHRRLRLQQMVAQPTTAQPAPAAFAQVLCAGYEARERLLHRSDALSANAAGLGRITSDSPTTIIGLAAELRRGDSPDQISGPPATPPLEPAADICARDAAGAEYAVPATFDASMEALGGDITSVIEVYSSIILPVVREGLTRLDRARRMRALRAWAHDEQGLPLLERHLAEAQTASQAAFGERRRQVAGDAYLAYVAFVDAARALGDECGFHDDPLRDEAGNVVRDPDGLEVAGLRYFATQCVRERTAALSDELNALSEATAAYDAVFDVDPTGAIRDSREAADILRRWLRGELTPEQQAAAHVAWLAAAQSWLNVISKSEGFWEGETEEQLQAAAQQLEDALGLNRPDRRRRQTGSDAPNENGTDGHD